MDLPRRSTGPRHELLGGGGREAGAAVRFPSSQEEPSAGKQAMWALPR